MNFSVKNKLIGLMIVVTVWLNPGLSLANPTVLLVSSNSHFGVVHRIEAALSSQSQSKIKIIHLIVDKQPENTPLVVHPQADLIVTIGQDPLAKLLKTPSSTPLLSILTRKSSFEALLKENKYTVGDPHRPITAIFPDQPLARHFALIKSLSPTFAEKTVGILLSPHVIQDQEALVSLANQYGLKLSLLNVNNDENPVAVLDGLLNEVKVVLALPDQHLYNTNTARGMLLTGFHKRIPLIGYSRTFVNNGALAAIYATNKQIAQQTADEIFQILQHKDQRLPEVQYPREFSISINHQVEKMMKLSLNKEEDIINSIKQLEKEPLGL